MQTAMQPKDYATLTTAIIGCILAIISFTRTLLLERRLTLEPYFKANWPNLQKNLSAHLDATRSWIFDVERGKDTRGYFPHPIHQMPKIDLDSDIRKYSRQLSKAFDKYIKSVDQLNSHVSQYNELIDPTTFAFRLLLMSLSVPEEYPNESEEVKKEEQFRVESARKIARKYIGSDKTTNKDLANNLRYQKDLSFLEDQIKGSLEKVKVKQKELSRLVKLYSARFA